MKIKYSARFDLVHWLKWSFSYTIYFRLGRVCYVPCFFSSAINAIVVICGSVEFFFPYVFSLFVGAFFPTKKKKRFAVRSYFVLQYTNLTRTHPHEQNSAVFAVLLCYSRFRFSFVLFYSMVCMYFSSIICVLCIECRGFYIV